MNPSNVLYTALGVLLVWSTWGVGGLSVKYLNARLQSLDLLSPTALFAVELTMTMLFGVVLAITFVQPQTPQQAIAAGMGWTSLVVKPTQREG